MSDLSKTEWNILMTFAPYPDGVEVDLSTFKPAMQRVTIDLVSRGFIEQREQSGEKDFFKLSETGKAACKSSP